MVLCFVPLFIRAFERVILFFALNFGLGLVWRGNDTEDEVGVSFGVWEVGIGTAVVIFNFRAYIEVIIRNGWVGKFGS